MNNKKNAHIYRQQQNLNSGFTLLELMVVIIIVGIMFSFLALSIRGDSPEEAIKTEAQRLNQLIQVALEEAILRGEEYAIVFTPNSYQFAHLTHSGWQYVQKNRQLRLRELPQDITIELVVDKSYFSFDSNSSNNNNANKKTLEPQIFLLSSGEITPEFTVDIMSLGLNISYRIVGKANGHHSISNNGE